MNLNSEEIQMSDLQSETPAQDFPEEPASVGSHQMQDFQESYLANKKDCWLRRVSRDLGKLLFN